MFQNCMFVNKSYRTIRFCVILPKNRGYVNEICIKMALLHKDLKVKTSHIYSNLSDNSGMWSA